ncbi:MAG: Tm-1-like ATP-binding domain-containing protein [Actinomycetota bacterium]|nr:Tm-1-like ATP-binding domain-containing protein [Actinomycetota bacterium]
MDKKILLIGTLDTKGEEFGYLKSSIEATGLQTMVMDAGVLGQPSFEPDIGRSQVARAGGKDIARLIEQKDRGKSMEAMMAGVVSIVQRLYDEEKISGIMGMGGGSGTNLACAAMRVLPFGFPKLVISTLASGDTEPFIQDKDIMMLFSVADILGLNPIIRKIISNGAAAMAGMVKANLQEIAAGKQQKERGPLISATMMGTTTDCVTFAKKIIEDKNMEIVAFAASTSGGRAMENLIGEGLVQGVLDITTTEIINTVAGGVFPPAARGLKLQGSWGCPRY